MYIVSFGGNWTSSAIYLVCISLRWLAELICACISRVTHRVDAVSAALVYSRIVAFDGRLCENVPL